MTLAAPELFHSLANPAAFSVGDRLTSADIDWLIATGQGPAVYAGMKRTEVHLAGTDQENLLAVSLSGRFDASNRAQGLSYILEQAGPDNGIALLKGILFAHNYYSEPHFRPMSDIDLLVMPDKLSDVTQLLLDLGAEQRALEDATYFDDHHHLMPFHLRKQGIWVEVHTGLFPVRSGLAGEGPFDPRHIHKLTQTIEFCGTPALALTNEMQFFHTSVHWAEEFRMIGGMFGLIDLYLLLSKVGDSLDWDWIFKQSNNRVHIAPAQFAISYLERADLLTVPNDVRTALRKYGQLCTPAIKTLQTIVDKYLVLGSPRGALLSDANLITTWNTTLHSGNNLGYLAKLPWNVAFPAEESDRFTLKFQMERLRSAQRRTQQD